MSKLSWMSRKEKLFYYGIMIPIYVVGLSWGATWLWVWWKVMFIL